MTSERSTRGRSRRSYQARGPTALVGSRARPSSRSARRPPAAPRDMSSTSPTPAGSARRFGPPELLALLGGLAFLALTLGGPFLTGTSWDEVAHRNLGTMALDFYRTGGADRAATESVMRYYGALHALVGTGFEHLFPGLHWVFARHLASVLFATIGFVYAVRLARLVAGPWAGAV